MGLFECNRMPFGLQNAPATFQRLMQTRLEDQNYSTVLLYLDDIIVFSSTFDEHIQRLEKVFTCLWQHGLKLKPSKCHLLKKQVKYLGHIVSASGIATDPDKISQVHDWKTPCNRKEVLWFLGFTGYYRRYIKGYSNIVSPMYKLTTGDPKRRKKGKNRHSLSVPSFIWTDKCQKSFKTLKYLMTSAPILAFADYTQPFILQTDASGVGLGAILSQIQNGYKRVIAYASRGLSPAETRYPAHKLEFLALKWAVTDKLRDYLLGNKFTVWTDNNHLLYVMTSAKLDATGQRWVAALSNFDFTVKYKPGKSNAAADALSRKPLTELSSKLPFNIETQTIPSDVVQAICDGHPPTSHPFIEASAVCQVTTRQQARLPPSVKLKISENKLPGMSKQQLALSQRDDLSISWVIYLLEKGQRPDRRHRSQEPPECLIYLRQWDKLELRDHVLYRVRKTPEGASAHQLVLPECYRETAMTGLHNDIGHMGFDRTLDMVRLRFFWPRMALDVKKWCEQCQRCCLRKTSLAKIRAPLISIHTNEPLELVCIDYLKLEWSKGGHENILVITDHFTKYAQAFPTLDQKAETVARVLWESFIQH